MERKPRRADGLPRVRGDRPPDAALSIGPIKRAILEENNSRLYGSSAAKRTALSDDKVGYWNALYDRQAEGRTNLAYGYLSKGA